MVKQIDNSSGIILEGGAMRSVFTAGVLDYLLERDVQFPNVLAVSAGAYAGMNYVSGQSGRAMDAVIEPLREYKYQGFRVFLHKGTLFDMDFLFDEVPRRKAPFDFQAFMHSTKRFVINTVNCLTGECVYFDEFGDQEDFFKLCRAGNSLPYIARISQIDGQPMLDGGVGEPVPIGKAIEEGWKKIVMVFTRDDSYRKKNRWLYILGARLIYRKYPKLVELIRTRAKRYNDELDQVARLEQEGRVFVIRPTSMTVRNNESNVERLKAYYQHGYDTAKAQYDELMKFLGK